MSDPNQHKLARSWDDSAPDGGGTKIGIKRIGSAVQVYLRCGCDYQAIALYDLLLEGAQKGQVVIELRKT